MTVSEQERLATLETSGRYMADKMDCIDKKVDALDEKLDKNFNILLDRIDSKCAAKWVEWVVKGMIGLILVTVFAALLSKVII